MINDLSFSFSPYGLTFSVDGKPLPVMSMVSTTIMICSALTLAPWMAPALMQYFSNSRG